METPYEDNKYYHSDCLVLLKVLGNKHMFFLILTEGSLVNKRDLLALYLSGTSCHKTSTRPHSCVTPRQPSIHEQSLSWLMERY